MALLDATGFETLGTASNFFDSFPASTPSLSTAYGRNGSVGMQGTHFARDAIKNLGTTVTTFICGFAYKIQLLGVGNSTLFRLLDNSNVQFEMYYSNDGIVHCTGTASTWTISTGVYMHIESAVTIGNSTGAVAVRLNGIEVLNVTGIDTQQTGNAYCTQFECLTRNTNNNEVWMDDLTLMDDTGTAFNGFIGDKRIIEQLPTGDGSVVTMTPSTGTDLYACVDDSTPNGDTDYISSSTPGDRALFTFPALPVVTGDVLGMNVVFVGRKDDAGTRTVRGSVRSGGTDANGTTVSLPTSYARLSGQFLTDPDTGSPWTIASVNAAETGVEVVA